MSRKKSNVVPAVIGFDTETMQGPPITIQLYSDDVPAINCCEFLGNRDPTAVFLKKLEKCLMPGYYRMYGHNLEFDVVSLLWNHRHSIKDGDIDITFGDWRIQGRYSKPIFLSVDDGQRHITIVDSLLWFAESLERAAQRVCPQLPKLKRPRLLGQKLFEKTDDEFVAYAMRDAEVAYFLGIEIEKLHKTLDIAPQISLASMAATVFRCHFMRSDIYQPPMHEWMVGAAASYHGGVNRIACDRIPSWHTNVTALDISSAYPHAMTALPSCSNPALYKKYQKTLNPKGVPNNGIYRVSGTADKCLWPALFDHNFSPLSRSFRDIWVTGYELNEALRMKEITIKTAIGYFYEDIDKYSPFKEYSMTFYKMKSDKKNPKTLQYMYKIVLNALTGKFIQTHPEWVLIDGHLQKLNKAGGLYHPYIASLITGHTRARIHALEHEYSALHTATDGIFVPGFKKGAEKKELGAVIAEGHGDLALFRNKLYIFYTDSMPEDKQAVPSVCFKDRYIQKFARHGFQAPLGELETMLISSNRDYTVNKPVKLKTAMRGDGIANKFVVSPRSLKVADHFEVINHDD